MSKKVEQGIGSNEAQEPTNNPEGLQERLTQLQNLENGQYPGWQKPEDMNELRLKQIQHFFEHYKDLEKGKWVKVDGWGGPDDARAEILEGVANYKKTQAE